MDFFKQLAMGEEIEYKGKKYLRVWSLGKMMLVVSPDEDFPATPVLIPDPSYEDPPQNVTDWFVQSAGKEGKK